MARLLVYGSLRGIARDGASGIDFICVIIIFPLEGVQELIVRKLWKKWFIGQ